MRQNTTSNSCARYLGVEALMRLTRGPMVRSLSTCAVIVLVTFASGGLAGGKPLSVTALNRQIARLEEAGKYKEAIPLARRALALRERELGFNHAKLVP